MAIQGNLWAPAPEVTSVPDRISAYIAQRFPTPSITAGTLFSTVPLLSQFFIDPIPVGDLVLVGNTTSPLERISATHIGRFVPPPAPSGFLLDLNYAIIAPEGEEPVVLIEQLYLSSVIFGAVYPESMFLEPTTGQIWPRIG